LAAFLGKKITAGASGNSLHGDLMTRLIAALFLGLALAVSALPAYAATKVTVNGVPISDIDISQRVALMKLEGGGTAKAATEALIDEQLQLQEAARLNMTISDQQVEEGLLQVARNVKLSSDKLREVLTANGVRIDTLRSRLRAAIAWQQLQQMAVLPRVTINDAALDAAAAAKLGSESSYDYILKEVLFIVAGNGSASQRTADANRYRQAFNGCDSAVQVSLNYTDAAVRDLGRRHATQLPEALAKELAALNVGGISKPRVVENGVSMLAVCSKTSARDLTFIKNNLRAEQGSEAMKGEIENYMAGLRKKAQIVYE
jgi:peptidyl-prolyl cis-trans isomerase SurA